MYKIGKRKALQAAFNSSAKKTRATDSEIEEFLNYVSDSDFCGTCGNFKNSKEGFRQHFKHCIKKYPARDLLFHCIYCDFTANTHLKLAVHIGNLHMCTVCAFKGSNEDLENHQHSFSQEGGRGKQHLYKFKKIPSFEGYVLCYRHSLKYPFHSFLKFMNEFQSSLKIVVKDGIDLLKCVKAQVSVLVKFKRISGIYSPDVEYKEIVLNSNLEILLNRHQFKNFFNNTVDKIENTISLFQDFGSGWVLHSILSIDVRMAKFRPLKAGCWIPTPEKILRKKAVINVRSLDEKCFMWAFLAAMHPVGKSKNSCRYSSYKDFVGNYNFSRVKFPVRPRHIEKFEKDNNNIAVNVFRYDKKEGLLPYHISKNNNNVHFKIVNLMILHSRYTGKCHYVTITKMSALIGKRGRHQKHLCFRCLQTFKNAIVLIEHTMRCESIPCQKVEMPKYSKKDGIPKIYFKSFQKQLRVPYVIYCDFETLVIKRKQGENNIHNENSYTNKVKKHKLSGFSYVVVKQGGQVIKHQVYRGYDAIDVFFREISRIGDKIQKIYSKGKKMIFTEKDKIVFENAKSCGICHEEFVLGEEKVRDHCRIEGHFRFAAHRLCNIQYSFPKRTPVITHNFMNFDSKLVVQGFKRFGKKFFTIPRNSEKLLSVGVDNLIFLDSYQFLKDSLEQLAINLHDEGKGQFPITTQVFGEKKAKLATQKGVYPYDWVDSFKRFRETHLPKRKYFYNSLKSKSVSKKEYKHALHVFTQFKMKNFGEYSDFYCLSDSCLIADCFEEFRNVSLNSYGLDPCHYFSAAGLAFDSALKMTRVRLDMIVDSDIYETIESNIRGGLSVVSHRSAEANNIYMENYDPQKPSSFIFYTDKNNLYGESMSQCLGTGEFRTLTEEEIASFNVNTVPKDSEKGYFIVCDLEYSKHLHNSHDQFPLCPEKITISKEQLSNYQKYLLQKLGINYNENAKKLIAHLGPRNNYCIHYRNLQYALEKGLKLKKIHKVIEFSQSKWLAPFIKFNTAKRKLAKSVMEKDYWKLMNNSVYGHFLKDKRKYISIKIINNWEDFQKKINDPLVQNWKKIGKDLFLVVMKQKKAILDSAIYNAFIILELSKLSMQVTHYEHFKAWFGNRACLLFHDTDSLCYHIFSDDVYEELLPHMKHFDTSDYDKGHFLYSEKNKKRIGKMTDEAKGNQLVDFKSVGSKSYSIIGEVSTRLRKMAAKGVPKRIQEDELSHQIFDKVLHSEKKEYWNMMSIRSNKHKLYTVNQRKSVLHAFCSKRFICDDGVSTKAWNNEKNCP